MMEAILSVVVYVALVLQQLASPHVCARCRFAGQRSTVSVVSSARTVVGWDAGARFDEDGGAVVGCDPNVNVHELVCSRGHRWTYEAPVDLTCAAATPRRVYLEGPPIR
jgi:hypothetical protein